MTLRSVTSLLIAMWVKNLAESLLPHELYHILKITQNLLSNNPSVRGRRVMHSRIRPFSFQHATLFPMSYDVLCLPINFAYRISQTSPLAYLNSFCFLRRSHLSLGWRTRSWPSSLHLKPRFILNRFASKHRLDQENLCESINSVTRW